MVTCPSNASRSFVVDVDMERVADGRFWEVKKLPKAAEDASTVSGERSSVKGCSEASSDS